MRIGISEEDWEKAAQEADKDSEAFCRPTEGVPDPRFDELLDEMRQILRLQLRDDPEQAPSYRRAHETSVEVLRAVQEDGMPFKWAELVVCGHWMSEIARRQGHLYPWEQA